MKHPMHLNEEPYQKIKNGLKVIEVRCNDEKRQNINIGDIIEFENLKTPRETILTEVIGRSTFGSFKDLYSSFHYSMFGHPLGTTLENQLKTIYETYTKEKELKYGALGIHIKLV